jgi:hypothetical protein
MSDHDNVEADTPATRQTLAARDRTVPGQVMGRLRTRCHRMPPTVTFNVDHVEELCPNAIGRKRMSKFAIRRRFRKPLRPQLGCSNGKTGAVQLRLTAYAVQRATCCELLATILVKSF